MANLENDSAQSLQVEDLNDLGHLIFEAGRASIYLKGGTTPSQHQLILDVASLLRNALGEE